MAVEMAKNIASSFDAKIEYLESTYGNSVLDLQSGKIDLAFALNPTPQRALVIGFSRPVFMLGIEAVCRLSKAISVAPAYGDIANSSAPTRCSMPARPSLVVGRGNTGRPVLSLIGLATLAAS